MSIQLDDVPLKFFASEIPQANVTKSATSWGILSKEKCFKLAAKKLHLKEDALDTAIKYLDQISILICYTEMLFQMFLIFLE